MAERVSFSTQELVVTAVQNMDSCPLLDSTSWRERVAFGDDIEGIAIVFKNAHTGKLEFLDHGVADSRKGITFNYDYNHWAKPFGKAYIQDNDGPYKAVISFASWTLGQDGQYYTASRYGTFWYDTEGVLKVVHGGSISQIGNDESLGPSVKFKKTPDGEWQIFRTKRAGSDLLHFFLDRKPIQPEKVIVVNRQELELDELVYCLTDDGSRFKFHSRSLTGHKQKTVEVPSVINIPRWAAVLERLNGEWTKALTEFPCSIELLV